MTKSKPRKAACVFCIFRKTLLISKLLSKRSLWNKNGCFFIFLIVGRDCLATEVSENQREIFFFKIRYPTSLKSFCHTITFIWKGVNVITSWNPAKIIRRIDELTGLKSPVNVLKISPTKL